MKYGSVCSGVEAATLAWKSLGWKCVFVSEVEPFPCAVLQHRFGASAPINQLDPNDVVITAEEQQLIAELTQAYGQKWMKHCKNEDLVNRVKDKKMRESWMRDNALLNKEGVIPNEGDFTKIGDKYAGKIDLLVGGTPCFVAGTMVLTPSGYVPIETLEVGDDIVSGTGKVQKVEAIGSKDADVVKVYIGGRKPLFCTADHQFYCVDSADAADADFHKIIVSEAVGKYIGGQPCSLDADDMRFSQEPERSVQCKNRKAYIIERFEKYGKGRVFNITVSEEHHYIAEGLWSANCQDLSVAGKRAGFDGERSSLALDFVRLAYESKCKYFVWENVPGCLSSNNGRDFATLLSLFTGTEIAVPKDGWGTAGFVCNGRRDRYGVAWRTLDGQFTRSSEFPFAVPQRRRRVFLVGYFGDWRRAAEILLEPGRLQWDTPSRFKARERVAEIVGANPQVASGKLRTSGESSADRHWDSSGVNPALNQCNAGSGTIGASNQELFAQNFNGLVTSLGESGKGFYNEQTSAQTPESHEDQHRRNIVFWNGADCAESLTCTSDRQLMPDKARLQCVIEQSSATGASFEINYGCPVESELAHTRKVGTASGTYNGVIENREVAATLTATYADKMGLENQHIDQGAPNFVINGVACDMYNQSIDGEVSKSLNSAASDADHVPTVINSVVTPNGEDLSDTLDVSYYKGVGSRNGNERTIICEQDSKYYQWHSHNITAKEIVDQVPPTLQAGMGEGGASMTTPMYVSSPICLNDQGGSVMSVEDDGNAGTLRANTHGNEQIVCGAFLGRQGAKAQGLGYSETVSLTVRASTEVDLVQTLKIRSGKEGGGKGALVQDNLSATQGCGNDQTLFVVHGAQTPISNDEGYANPLGCCNDGLENVISMHNKQFGTCEENLASTLLSTDYKEPQVVCYENHANDSRITESNEVSPLLSSRAGTGGGNLPLVQECYSVDRRNQSLDSEVSNTLNTVNGGDNYNTVMQECNAIDSVNSNAMKSANPNSGFHKEEIAKTLDTTDPNPTKNQGGNVIVDAVAVAENIIGRADNAGGNGIGAQEELAYTQNATGVMGVCTKGNGDAFESEVHTSLSASGGGQAGQGYPCARIASTVRRLLPICCERLMGFPDNHTQIPYKGQSAENCPDSPRYKACGNSMCVNVMQWIGEQIERVEGKYKNESN